jgi:hypothetical protein
VAGIFTVPLFDIPVFAGLASYEIPAGVTVVVRDIELHWNLGGLEPVFRLIGTQGQTIWLYGFSKQGPVVSRWEGRVAQVGHGFLEIRNSGSGVDVTVTGYRFEP